MGTRSYRFNVHGFVHHINILLHIISDTALHVSGVIITHRQEHKTTVTTASGNRCM